MTAPGGTRLPGRGGFTLLEVILAVAIFAMAGMALLGAIKNMAWSSTALAAEAELLREMESLLREHCALEDLQDEGGADVSDRASELHRDLGTRFWIEQTKEEGLATNEGVVLDGIYRVTVVARRDDGTERRLSTLHGQPRSLPFSNR